MKYIPAKLPGNKYKSEKVIHKQKKTKHSGSTKHAQRMIRDIQEGETQVQAKHAPLRCEFEAATIKDILDIIIAAIEIYNAFKPDTIDLTLPDAVDLTLMILPLLPIPLATRSQLMANKKHQGQQQ